MSRSSEPPESTLPYNVLMRSASAMRAFKPAREVHGHVLAAEREAVGVHEAAAREDRHRRGAGAHVDQGGAEIGLVVGEHRQPGRIGARHHRLDVEMAALDRQHQVARHRDVGGHDVHVDAEATARACRAGRGCRWRRRANSRSAANAARRGRAAPNAGCRRRARARYRPRSRSRRRRRPRRRLNSLPSLPAETETTTEFELHLGGALGEVDRLPHGLFRLRQVDHRAGLDAARQRMAEADHVDRLAAAEQHAPAALAASAARSGRRSCWCRHRAPPPAPSASATAAWSSA